MGKKTKTLAVLVFCWGLGAPLGAQPAPRFFLDRVLEVQGCLPKEGDSAAEARRESILLQKLSHARDNFPVHLNPALSLSPRPGEKLWVFYDSVCRGSLVVRGLKAQKTGGPIPVKAWFELDASSLPATVEGNGRWLERALYLEARPSEKEPTPIPPAPGLQAQPEYVCQQLFTRMMQGLKNPPP
ncbi:MAG TPA: hypothetical protein VMU88_02255, partial [bacterium]|nr:hypothetical protein [bacterium]